MSSIIGIVNNTLIYITLQSVVYGKDHNPTNFMPNEVKIIDVSSLTKMNN